MAAKLTDAERERIVTLIESGKGCAETAKLVGRANDTVSRIAKDIGWTFGKSNLAHAHEARSAYSAERRATAAADIQERIGSLLASFEDERQVTLATGKGIRKEMTSPDWRAVRDLATAISTLQRTVLDIKRADERGGDHEARGLLERIAESLDFVAGAA